MRRRRLAIGAAATAVSLTATIALNVVPVETSALAKPAKKPVGLPATAFPLGTPSLPKTTSKSLATGVDYFTLRAGTSSDGYTVSLTSGGQDFMAELTAQTQALAAQDAGFEPVVVKFSRPAMADFPGADFWSVHIGQWTLKQKADAAKVVKQLKDAGIPAKVDFIGDDGFATTGPWTVRVLMIDPKKFRGSYQSSLGTSVAKREKVSAMAKAAHAIAGVNGGFFDIHTLSAYRGDPTGISVVGGKLLSEAVAGRTGLVLRGRKARITELSSSVTAVSSDGNRTRVGGLNRVALPGELVMYTPEFGTKTPQDEGVEVVLDAEGTVTKVRSPGAKVPAGMRVLHGVGAAADWLWAHAWEGWKVAVTTTVTDLRTGKGVPLTPDTYIIGGQVRLLRGGQPWVTAKTDGMWGLTMILRRHPRTLAGITRTGKLIVAVIDGREPGVTIGASYLEAARLMQWLGARDAVNLDGGGSTTMVVGGKVVNKPSDGSERGVGDSLLITP